MVENREKLLDEIEQMAIEYEVKYRGCSQCVLEVLDKQLKLNSGLTTQAASTLSGGVTLKGEVCGAVSGSLLAIGLALGRKNVEEGQPGLIDGLRAGRKFWKAFEEEFGSCICKGLQEQVAGRTFNLAYVKDYEAWLEAGGEESCPKFVGKAARIAAEIILEGREAKEKA